MTNGPRGEEQERRPCPPRSIRWALPASWRVWVVRVRLCQGIVATTIWRSRIYPAPVFHYVWFLEPSQWLTALKVPHSPLNRLPFRDLSLWFAPNRRDRDPCTRRVRGLPMNPDRKGTVHSTLTQKTILLCCIEPNLIAIALFFL